MQWNRDASALQIFQHRIGFVKYWTEIACKLKPKDEAALRQAPVHLQKLLAGKWLALWQVMVDYYDKRLVQDIISGFPVTGWMPDSQVFPQEFRPPSLTVEALQSLSKGINERVKTKVLSSADSELAAATWSETQKELVEGWMEVDGEGGQQAAWP